MRNSSFKKVFRKLLLDSIILHLSLAVIALVLNKWGRLTHLPKIYKLL